MGGDKNDDLGWRPPVYFALVAVAAVVAYALWPNWQNYCPATEVLAECSRQWISALSGWAATIAALVTVVLLRRQIVVSREMYDEDKRDRAAAIASAIAIDLVHTATLVKGIKNIEDFGSGVSLTGAELFKDAVYVHRRLAAALRMHLVEVEQLRQSLRRISDPLDESAKKTILELREKQTSILEFRCTILARAFMKAAQDLGDNRPPTRPFVSDALVQEIARETKLDTDQAPFVKLLQ